MKTQLEVLQEARDLLAKPGVWCRDALARDRHGNTCEPYEPQAEQWCLLGAIKAIYVNGLKDCRFGLDVAVSTKLEDLIGGRPIGTWNDNQSSVEPILALLDKAIAQERGEA